MEFENQQQAGTEVGGHFDDVRTTLSHAKDLLQDAVNRLLEDALKIRSASSEQRIALASDDPEKKEALLRLGRTIEDGTNDLIMHLQFQDMVTQLLGHVQVGLSALEEGSGRDERQAQGDSPASSGVDQVMNDKPVMSRDMQAGDVELF